MEVTIDNLEDMCLLMCDNIIPKKKKQKKEAEDQQKEKEEE